MNDYYPRALQLTGLQLLNILHHYGQLPDSNSRYALATQLAFLIESGVIPSHVLLSRTAPAALEEPPAPPPTSGLSPWIPNIRPTSTAE